MGNIKEQNRKLSVKSDLKIWDEGRLSSIERALATLENSGADPVELLTGMKKIILESLLKTTNDIDKIHEDLEEGEPETFKNT